MDVEFGIQSMCDHKNGPRYARLHVDIIAIPFLKHCIPKNSDIQTVPIQATSNTDHSTIVTASCNSYYTGGQYTLVSDNDYTVNEKTILPVHHPK